MVVFPARRQWQRHENTFNTAARFEPEDGATVIHEVIFNVACASNLLPFLLLLCERFILAALDQRQVGVAHIVCTVRAEVEDGILVTVVKVIEEDTSDTATFVTMLDEKVVVTPLLELAIVLIVVSVAALF